MNKIKNAYSMTCAILAPDPVTAKCENNDRVYSLVCVVAHRVCQIVINC